MENTRRGGRPARTPEPGERVPLSWRVTPEFKAKLDLAAERSGRSVAQEIELRLEASLQEERHLEDALDLAFGAELAALVLLLATVMQHVGWGSYILDIGAQFGRQRRDWIKNPFAFDQVVQAVNKILEYCRPDGERLPDHVKKYEHSGASTAVIYLNDLVKAKRDPNAKTESFDSIINKTREKLDFALVNRIWQKLEENREGVPDLAERPPRRKRGAQPRQSLKRNA